MAERPSRRERRERDVRKRRGGMAYPSSIIDPKTGESLSGGPNTEEAKRQRLRFALAFKRLDAGDEEGYTLLMTGKDLPPDHSAKFEARKRKDRAGEP